MARCPTCGQRMPQITDPDQLVAVMKTEDRQVYKGQDGNWYLTKGGGPISDWVIDGLRKAGRIRDQYSDLPNQYFTTGKTIDMQATLAARKGKPSLDWQIVYVEA